MDAGNDSEASTTLRVYPQASDSCDSRPIRWSTKQLTACWPPVHRLHATEDGSLALARLSSCLASFEIVLNPFATICSLSACA